MSKGFWDAEDLEGAPSVPKSSGFWDREDIQKEAPGQKKFDALKELRKIDSAIVAPVGKASEFLSKYSSAPIKSGIDALQHGEGLGGAWDAAKKQFGEDPNLAPTGKGIAKNFGIPATENINTHLITNPFTHETLHTSPAGIAGAGVDALVDPLTYVGGEMAELPIKVAGKVAEGVAPEVAQYLRLKAAQRAVKAASGGSDPNMRAILGVPLKGGTEAQTKKAFLREGGNLLKGNEELGTEKAVGWLGNSKNIAKKAEENLGTLKGKFNEVGDELERVVPNGVVSGEKIGDDLINYAISIPDVGGGTALRNRLLEEGIKLQKQGNMSFNQAQKVKGQFQFIPQTADALTSNQDVTNKIKQIITSNMDESVAKVAEIPGANKELLGQYPQMKKEYATSKNVSGTGADQYRRDVSRNSLSPSSKFLGGIASAVMALKNPAAIPMVVAGATVAGANQVALKQGPAFMANLANTLSKAAAASPEIMAKYAPVLEKAANKGAQSVVVAHHTLMENDPEYRKLFDQ